jgi:hypothetical protein
MRRDILDHHPAVEHPPGVMQTLPILISGSQTRA